MKAVSIRTAMVALTLIASFLFAPTKSNAQVKSTAAAVGFKAAKVAVVFNDVVKLADSIQKVSYRPSDDPAAAVKAYIQKQFEADGVEVADETGEGVADVTFYIGVDDLDDDNDGKPDTTDEQDYTNEAPADVKDSDIERTDLDETSTQVEAMPDTIPNQGIYILVVNNTTDDVDLYYMDADVLGAYQGSEASPSAINVLTPQNPHGESAHASFLRPDNRLLSGWKSAALNAAVGLYLKYIR